MVDKQTKEIFLINEETQECIPFLSDKDMNETLAILEKEYSGQWRRFPDDEAC